MKCMARLLKVVYDPKKEYVTSQEKTCWSVLWDGLKTFIFYDDILHAIISIKIFYCITLLDFRYFLSALATQTFGMFIQKYETEEKGFSETKVLLPSS